jgi:AAA domain
MKVVNLIAGPAAGKSTLASTLFAYAKRMGSNIELVTEYAKDMVWEARSNILDDQLYILAKQNRRLHRLREHVDWVITDSPLLLGMHYALPGYFKGFHELALDVFRSYDNINLFIERPPKSTYSKVGRLQDYEEAVKIDDSLAGLLHATSTPFQYIKATDRPADIWHNVIYKEAANKDGK